MISTHAHDHFQPIFWRSIDEALLRRMNVIDWLWWDLKPPHDWWVLPAVKIWTIWIVCCSPAFPHLNGWSLVQPNRSLPEPLIRTCEGGFDAQIGQSIGCCLSAIDGIQIERFKSRVCSTSSTCRDDGATLPFTTEGRKTPHELLIIELHSYATTKLQDHHNSRW